MDRLMAEYLCSVTDGFYESHANEFAATRQGAWAGWERCLDEMGLGPATVLPVRGLGLDGSAPLTVLDVGCGNLRFLRYLRQRLPVQVQLESFAVDNCERLLPDEETLANAYPFVRFQKLDVLQRIICEASLPQSLEAPRCHVVACFGLMHHAPGMQYRFRLLADLLRCVRPGGYVTVSFWQFMDSPDLAEQARRAHAQAVAELGIDTTRLDEGDFLLGWQGKPGAWRYCHHSTDAELDALLDSLDGSATLKARFRADGRTGGLNTYLVLQARG